MVGPRFGLDGDSASQHHLIGWMLRSNRKLGDNRELRTGKRFARAFPASESAITRWERGQTPVTYAVVRRYEELLGLEPNLLASIVDMMCRYWSSSQVAPARLERFPDGPSPAEEEAADRLCERVRAEAPMSGLDWDRLSAFVAATPQLRFCPRTIWDLIAERLLREMIISSGIGWFQRYEAMNRMLGHPVGQSAMIAACASLGADTSNQVFVETLAVLDASAHPDASRHVLDHIVRPVNEAAQFGALLACVNKVRHGHFDRAQTRTLADVITDLVLDPGRPGRVAPIAVELLRRTRLRPHGRRRDRLRRALAEDATLSRVEGEGRLVDHRSAAVVVARMTARQHVEGESAQIHGPLTDIVEGMLFSPIYDVRMHAAMMIKASPYQAVTAAALTTELTGALSTGDTTMVSSVLGALRVIGGDPQRRIVEGLLMDPRVRGPVTADAAHTIGHIGGGSSDRFWRQALDLHQDRWHRDPTPPHEDVLRGLIYALGIARNTDLLRQFQLDPRMPGPVRRSTGWWLSIPEVVWASVYDPPGRWAWA